MTKLSTSDIKKLRDITGAGFLDCKEALENSTNDIEKAIDFLRKKGISTAQKKGDRTASEGLIAISKNESNNEASIIEINSETDFVARNADFQDFVSNISNIALKNKGDKEKINNDNYQGSDIVSQSLTNLISKIGENLSLRRSNFLEIKNGYIGTYIHNVEKDNMGKIGVIISVETGLKFNDVEDFLKKICMHIAASNPISITSEEIDQDINNKEKEFQLDEIKKSGKDENIHEKILQGKMNKYFNEVVLLEQNFVMDDSIKINKFIEETEKNLNGNLKIKKFIRFKVGEGI